MLRSILAICVLLPISSVAEPLSGTCLASESAAFNEAENSRMAALTREMLITRRFGLFSFVYSIVPKDGYPLTFAADGTVHAMQFNGARWTLKDGEVHLWNSNDEVFRTFRYNPRCNSLTSTVDMGDQPVLMEIAVVEPAT